METGETEKQKSTTLRNTKKKSFGKLLRWSSLRTGNIVESSKPDVDYQVYRTDWESKLTSPQHKDDTTEHNRNF